MRGFFVLLLITNLLFVGWQIWFVPQSEERPPHDGIELANSGLLLLAELEEAKRPPQRKFIPLENEATETPAPNVERIEAETPADVAGAVIPSSTTLCYQSTPLVSLKDAKALQDSLVKLGIPDSRRETIQTHMVNYWVMLRPYKSLDKANEATDILKKQRIKDFFIVRSGRYENAVSLGVFSTRERAEKRYEEISGLKVQLRKPVIESLELPAKRLVVRVKLDVSPAPEGLSAFLDSSKELHLKKTSCN